jgi:hypothetical protein
MLQPLLAGAATWAASLNQHSCQWKTHQAVSMHKASASRQPQRGLAPVSSSSSSSSTTLDTVLPHKQAAACGTGSAGEQQQQQQQQR